MSSVALVVLLWAGPPHPMKPAGYDRYVFPQGIDDIDEKTELRDRNPIAWASMKMGAGQNIPGFIAEAAMSGHSTAALPFKTLQQCRAEAARDIPLFEQVAESKYQTIASYRCVVVPDNEQLTFYAGGRDRNGRYGVNPYGLVKQATPDGPSCAHRNIPWPQDEASDNFESENDALQVDIKCHVYQGKDHLWYKKECSIDKVDGRVINLHSEDDQKYVQPRFGFIGNALSATEGRCSASRPDIQPGTDTAISHVSWEFDNSQHF